MAVKSILVLYLGHRGAGPEYAYEMTKGLLANGVQVYAIISRDCENADSWKKLALQKLIMIDSPAGYAQAIKKTLCGLHGSLVKIKREMRGIVPDVCYTPMGHSWDGVILNHFKRKGSRIVCTLHDVVPHKGENSWKQLPMKVYDKLFNHVRVDKYVILSESFRNIVVATRGVEESDVIVIPHGTFDNYRSKQSIVPTPLSKYNFLFFGRIVKYKGIGLLLEAYSRLSKERDDVSLRIVGHGDLSEYSEGLSMCKGAVIDNRFVDASEIQSFFLMPGTIVVLPYIDASQSGVIPIAMKEGCLLIVTDRPGLLEQTRRGTLALVAEPTAESVYEKMCEALSNPHSNKEIINRALHYIDSLSWPSLAKRLIEAF